MNSSHGPMTPCAVAGGEKLTGDAPWAIRLSAEPESGRSAGADSNGTRSEELHSQAQRTQCRQSTVVPLSPTFPSPTARACLALALSANNSSKLSCQHSFSFVILLLLFLIPFYLHTRSTTTSTSTPRRHSIAPHPCLHFLSIVPPAPLWDPRLVSWPQGSFSSRRHSSVTLQSHHASIQTQPFIIQPTSILSFASRQHP